MSVDEVIQIVGPSGVTAFGIWVGTLYIRNLLYQMKEQIFKELYERLTGLDDRLSRVERRVWND